MSLRAQLPNLISVSRFLLTPFAVVAIWEGQDGRAFWLSLLAGATDFLDGGIARWMKTQSRTGQILDPLADKFMLDCLYLTLALARGEWIGWVILARDAMIVGGSLAIAAATGHRDFPPSWLGKLSTVLQIAWILFYLGRWPAENICFVLMFLATIFSGADYLRIGVEMARIRPGLRN